VLFATISLLTTSAVPVSAAEGNKQQHWAFQPVRRPLVPTVRNARLIESPIDAFIMEKLETAGLTPAPAADKRTLIRRASYDLIGLPPTPVEVADFLADESPEAFTTVIERLLASPHYGERWGRHWLDVARYANTRGDTGAADPVSPYAFTYRDYVMRAFNDDLPFDRFLIEQIAADLLDLGDNSPTLAALGFITVGRRFLNNVHDTIDDRIDVVTRGTMALTVSCARCHDHKYDPIPTRDYYGLYGVFASSHEPEPLPVIGQPDPTEFSDYRSQREKLESSRVDLIRQKEAEIAQRYRRLTTDFLLESRTPAEPERAEQAGNAFEDTSVLRTGTRRWRKFLERLNTESDPIFAPWFAFAALPESEFVERAKHLSAQVARNGLAHTVNPLVAGAFAGDPPASLQEVAERYARVFAAAVDETPQQKKASPESPPERPAPADPDREALRRVLLADGAPYNLSEEAIRRSFPPMVKMQIQQMGSELDQLDSRHPGAPVRAMALADMPQPRDARVFVRGNPNNPGEEAPRQFVEVLAGPDRRPFTRGSGRLELAQAIASRGNALTARVLVNRVWFHHFGEGLVTTPDDFGVRSDPPSHPQLLDYLAARFMDDGWSLKKLHRLLMLSRVYRQASDDGLRSTAVDPENRLLAKMNRRRLDFESLRDTLLFVAGNLDGTVGGRAVELTPQQRVSLGGGFEGAPADRPPSRRRAIYAFIDRQNLPGVFRTFDFADPDTSTGRRFFTTVPQQALFFFNNPFVMQQACSLAARAVSRQLNSPAEQVTYLYQQILQREPTAGEIELALRFLAAENAAPASSADSPATGSASIENQRPLRPLERFTHVLLMSDELMFVD
jgi:hypothetical protein